MPEDLLRKAKTYFQEGALEKSLMVLMRYLEQNPNDPMALELRGDIAVKESYREEAVMRFERAAEVYSQGAEYERAIVCLEKMLGISPDQYEQLIKLAGNYESFGLGNEMVRKLISYSDAMLRTGKHNAFVDGLKRICEYESSNPGLRFIFSRILIALNRKEEAKGELARVKKLAQEQANTGLLEEINRYSSQFDGGEELDPKSRLELGNLLLEIGSKEEAIVEYMRAASDLINLGQMDEARKVFNRILELEPENEKAKAGLAKLGSRTTAMPAKEEKPKEVKKRETREEVYSESDILKDLISEVDTFPKIEEAKEEEPGDLSPAFDRAKGTDELSVEGQIADIEFLLKETTREEKPKAEEEISKLFEDFKSKITWDEGDPNKQYRLAQSFYEAGLYEKALTHFEAQKQKSQNRPLIIEMIGGCLVKLGRFAEALKILPEGLMQPVTDSEKLRMRYYLAQAYQGQGDHRNALIQLEKILKTDENYRDVKELYELLGGVPIRAEPVGTEPEPVIIEEPVIREDEKVVVDTMPEAIEEEPPIVFEEPPVRVESEYPVIIEETVEKVADQKEHKVLPQFEERKSEENIVFL